MPRHPLGEKAMTGAERQRKRRERMRNEHGATPDASHRERKPAGRAERASQNLVEARKEIDRLRQRLDEWEKFRPIYETWLEEADKIVKSRNGTMKKATFNRIRFALNPDSYQSIDRDERNRLSQEWEELRLALCNETEMPMQKPKTPKLNWADMMRRREESKRAKKRKSAR